MRPYANVRFERAFGGWLRRSNKCPDACTHRSITIAAITTESTAAFTNIRLSFKVFITFS